MNRSVTAGRSIAVDPAFTPLGAPVWLEKEGNNPIRRLMVAQDTGSAIKGAQRADVFFGTGDKAGRRAGKLRDPGRMVVLLPIQRAYALLPEGAE
jgi:membrane-bound lytic murein transglycosylase A